MMIRSILAAGALALGLGLPADSRAQSATVDAGAAAIAAERYAIVIGNSSYESVPDLANAAADAHAMAGFLREHGFRVIESIDVTKQGFEDLLRRATIEIPAGAEVVFYYAGHGIQIGRRNYIIPTDAELGDPTDTPFQTVTLDYIVEILSGRSRLQLIILDSCRNNPFTEAAMLTEVDATLYEARDGFSAMTAPINTLVAFATSPGFVAYDGTAGNSPYTSALIDVGTRSADDGIGVVLEQVRRAVYDATGGAQVPWESSTLVEPFKFAPETRGVTMIGSSEAVTGETVSGETGDGQTVTGETGTGETGTGETALPPAQRTVGLGQVTAGSGAGAEFALEGPLERRIALGAGLLATLGLSEGETVSISGGTAHGRLVVDGAARPEYDGRPLGPADLAALIYEPSVEPRRIAGPVGDYAITERMALALPSGSRDAVMTLTPQPCDYEAGDWLDPGGTGLARYPNEIDPDAALAACRAAIEAEPENGRFHYQLGRAAQAMLDYDTAREAFERAAGLEHVRAFHALGDLADVSASAEGGLAAGAAGQAALDLYAKGVAAGDPYALHAMGKQYLRYGVDDAQRRYGFDLLSRALELGHTFSMNELGYYFLRDDSPNHQPERGLRYLQESAARQDIYGYHNLGLVYENGLGGIAPDPAAALDWYTKAAEGGHPFAPVNIGRMHFGGKLGDPDGAEAIRWYDEGLARGVAWGGANAAWIIANQRPAGYEPVDAALRAAKAMALGDEEAAAAAGEVLASLPEREVNRATQLLLRDLGEDLTIDGLIGPETRGIVERRMQAAGRGAAPSDARGRAVAVAGLYWQENRFRVDLY